MDFAKYFQIFIALSPLFFIVLILSWIINRGFRKLEKHATYWLIGLILLLVILTYGIFLDKISPFSAVLGYIAVERYWQTYLKRKKVKS